ncbi:MAG: FecR domain-containing protein [bacterium]|nr:FecR domain-containing protein [bacterium]
MNRSSISRKLFLITTLLLLIPVSGYSLHVSFYIGDVTLIRNSKKVEVTNGTKVKSGDLLKTGEDASVAIAYDDGSNITIMSQSSAKIGSKNVKGSTNIALISGNIEGTFAKIKKGSRKVYTPTIVCAIRGTEFKLGVSKGGESRVDLSEGKLNINNPYGEVNLNEGQKVESSVAGGPNKGSSGSLESWKKGKDTELQKDPEEKGALYRKQIKKFGSRSKQDGKKMKSYKKMVKKAGDEKKLKKAGNAINQAEEKSLDDLLLNEASNASISDIMNDFKGRQGKIYNLFRKVKEESNKVMEQQERNYRAIQAVKEAHRQAYKKIMGKFQDDKDRILRGLDMDGVKPKMKND